MGGLFITFEGIEACGKSTQLAMLADWLRQNNRDIVETREPGGTDLGEKIRGLLRDGTKFDNFSTGTEILLFEASRAQHVEEKILPAMELGKIVLCDRFYDSTTVYQGCARKIEAKTVNFLNEFASHGCTPHMTIFLDVGVPESFKRIAERNGRRDRIEQEGVPFFEEVREGYLRLARENSRFFTVDGVGDVGTIHGKIRDEFERRFSKDQ
jgi:dTMP kinase